MIQRITDAAALDAAIHGIRKGATQFASNYFATPAQAHEWIKFGVLSCLQRDHCLMIFRRDRDFHHLYHVAANLESLGIALAQLETCDGFGAALTSDLVGRDRDLNEVEEIYTTCGFSRYQSLSRMARPAGSAMGGRSRERHLIDYAQPADAAMILAFLERQLDRFAEQIPTTAGIDARIAKKEILVVRRRSDLCALLIFSTTGLSSILRYWLVDAPYRDMGMGSCLIKTFFGLCRSCRRILLWVMNDNTDAIAKYEHYGFHFDGLMDRVMIQRKES